MATNNSECKHYNKKVIEGEKVVCANPDCGFVFLPEKETEKDNKDYDYVKWKDEQEKDPLTARIIVNHHCETICETPNLSATGDSENDGKLGMVGSNGEQSYLNIKYCPFCGIRIKCYYVDPRSSLLDQIKLRESYEKEIILKSAPDSGIFKEIDLNPIRNEKELFERSTED